MERSHGANHKPVRRCISAPDDQMNNDTDWGAKKYKVVIVTKKHSLNTQSTVQ